MFRPPKQFNVLVTKSRVLFDMYMKIVTNSLPFTSSLQFDSQELLRLKFVLKFKQKVQSTEKTFNWIRVPLVNVYNII